MNKKLLIVVGVVAIVVIAGIGYFVFQMNTMNSEESTVSNNIFSGSESELERYEDSEYRFEVRYPNEVDLKIRSQEEGSSVEHLIDMRVSDTGTFFVRLDTYQAESCLREPTDSFSSNIGTTTLNGIAFLSYDYTREYGDGVSRSRLLRTMDDGKCFLVGYNVSESATDSTDELLEQILASFRFLD